MTRHALTSIAFALSMTVGAACARSVLDDDRPGWLAALVAQLEREPVANPPAFIARYQYKGDTVYYLPPRCCDVAGELYNAAGSVICGPDGGLTGRGDGRCPDFFTERKDESIVWRDTRAAAQSGPT
jgi:hypothetical protein